MRAPPWHGFLVVREGCRIMTVEKKDSCNEVDSDTLQLTRKAQKRLAMNRPDDSTPPECPVAIVRLAAPPWTWTSDELD